MGLSPSRDARFDLDPQAARAVQLAWAGDVISDDQLGEVRRIAGVDVAYEKDGDRVCAAVVVLDANTLEVVEEATHVEEARFEYVPGLFSFRELPPVIACFAKLRCAPDLVVCDGQGRAHPRRFGLACHLGVLYDIPTIGCAKTRLVGEFNPPGGARGSVASLVLDDEEIGRVVRTRDDTRPLFISVGHRVSLDTAVQWILRLAPRYRLPETTRMADQRVNALRRMLSSG